MLLVHLDIRWQLRVLPSLANMFCFFVFGSDSPQWARASSFMRFLDNTQRRTTVGRSPLDEWSARRRVLYLTTFTTDKHPCPRWNSNPQSQQANGRRLTSRTVQSLGPVLPIGTVIFACHFCVSSKLNYLLRTQYLLYIFLEFWDSSLQH